MHADPEVLAAVAEGLRRTGQAVDQTGGTRPLTPDAGEQTAVMAAVLAHVFDGAANLVLGMLEAADRVDTAGTRYLNQDDNAAGEIRGLF